MSLAVAMILVGAISEGGGSGARSGTGFVSLGMDITAVGASLGPSSAIGSIALDVGVTAVAAASGVSVGTVSLGLALAGVPGQSGASAGTIALAVGLSAASAGGPVTVLTPWTITEQSGSGQTNVPIEVWVPFSAAGGAYPFISTDAVQIVDADGTTVIPCQEDNRSSDLTPDIRGVKVTAVLPTLTASQKRQLTVKKLASTAPDTGTDISTANIIATSYNCFFTMALDNGTTYTADAATALAASTWTNKTTAANTGKWRTGGGLVTEYICFCPFKNAGAPTPDNFGVWFEISAYKANRGAVGGGNPIIAIKTSWWIEAGYAQATGFTNHWFDLSVTCGTNAQSWIGSSPAKTLTLSTNGDQADAIATVPAGGTTFTANSVGMVIFDGTGFARIYQYDSATQVRVKMGTAMSGTSIGSGLWRLFGMNYQYASGIPRQEIWYGGSLAITSQPNIDSSLGVAWNTVSLTGGPFSYFNSCKAILPYTTPASQITNDMSRLNACGTNPTGMISGYAGDITLYMPTSGGRDDIGPIPGWYVGGLIRYDSNGKRRIMRDANKLSLFPIFWRDQNTGKIPLLNNGTNYVTDSSWGPALLPNAIAYYTGGRVQAISDATFQVAHHPGMQYVPYLLTGDFYYADQIQHQLFYIWAADDPGYIGSQLNRLSCNASELRGNGWSWRDLMQGIFMIPDRNPDVLSYTRSHLQTWYGNHLTVTNSGIPGTGPYPGINVGLINNTGVGKTYATNGYRSMGQIGGGNESQWQLGYVALAFFLGKGMGMVNTGLQAFMAWFMEGLTGAATNASIVPNWLVPCYYATIQTNGTGANVNSWLDVSRWTGNDITETGMNKRIVTGSGITLSGLTGTITVTMPASYFTTGGSAFYNGGFIIDLNAASLQVVPTVTAGGSGYAINDTINVSVQNASSNFTVSRVSQLKVTSVSGGAVTGVSINDAGLYIATSTGNYGNTGTDLAQTSTSGAGTGAAFNAASPGTGGSSPIRFGTGIITGVSGNVVTLSTSGSCVRPGLTVFCYPFAQTSLVSNKIMVPAPAVGDVNGFVSNLSFPALPIPFTNGYEYWSIALQSAFMANLYGFADGSAAYTYLSTNYTGGNELKWRVTP